MRLIDADALPWQVLWAWRAGEEVCAVTADDIDNVPTVCCKECVNEQECWFIYQQPDFGCADFERREP